MIWHLHFWPSVFTPTALCLIVSHRMIHDFRLRLCAVGLSSVVALKLYSNSFSNLDLNYERCMHILLAPTSLGEESRAVFAKYDENHWLLNEYRIIEIEQQQKRARNLKKNGKYYSSANKLSQWFSSKWYSRTILDTTADFNADQELEDLKEKNIKKSSAVVSNDDLLEYMDVDEEIYGNYNPITASFIPEYPLPTEELMFESNRKQIQNERQKLKLNYDKKKSLDNNTEYYEVDEQDFYGMRPDINVVNMDYWPKALSKSELINKSVDREFWAELGITDEDVINEYHLLEYSNESRAHQLYRSTDCWQLEEEWKKCKLHASQKKKGVTKKDCNKLLKDLQMCRMVQAMEQLK